MIPVLFEPRYYYFDVRVRGINYLAASKKAKTYARKLDFPNQFSYPERKHGTSDIPILIEIKRKPEMA